MRVDELLRHKQGRVVTVRPDATVRAAASLMIRERVGGLPIVSDDGVLAGFLAERDIVRALELGTAGVHELPVQRIMQRPAPSCAAADRLLDVMGRMTRDRLRHLVVMDGDRVVDVLSVGDLVKHRLEQLEIETGVLRDYVAGQRAVRFAAPPRS